MQTAEKRRRRRYTPAFKAAAVAACGKPGASVSAVALELQLNVNMLRMWIKRSRSVALQIEGPAPTRAFLPVPLTDPATSPSLSSPERSIRVRIRKGTAQITIEWPTSAAGACALWLRELIA